MIFSHVLYQLSYLGTAGNCIDAPNRGSGSQIAVYADSNAAGSEAIDPRLGATISPR